MKTQKNILLISFLFLLVFLVSGCEDKAGSITRGENLDAIQILAHYSSATERLKYWDNSEGSFYYFLPSGIDTDDLSVETENTITIRLKDQPESERKTFKAGDSLQELETGRTYLLGCYDINRYLYEVSVVFMKSENVSSIHIHTQNSNYYPMLENKDLKLPGSILMADKSGSVVYRGELDHIKGRGNGSWFSHKKPFNIKLSEPADLIGSGMSRKYSLLNQEMDPSAIRNKLGFELAEACGLDYTPNAEYVDLWLDGDYQGLYLLTDRIHVGEAGVDIDDLEAKTAAVNSMPLKDYPIITNIGMRYSDIPNNPEDISGGYLLELDTFYPNEKSAWFNTHRIFSVTLKSPSYATKEQVNYIHKLIQEMEYKITQPGITDDYKDYIDVDSWVRMILLQELLLNTDYMGSSQYFYKKSDSNLIYASPVWDLDQTFGPDTTSYQPYNTIMSLSFAWTRDLCMNESFNKELHSVYDKAFRPAVHDLLDNRIDELNQLLVPALTMNYTRWKSAALTNYGSAQPWEENTQNLKSFFATRVQLIEDLLENFEDYHALTYTKTIISPVYPNYFYRYCFVKHGTACDTPLTPPGLVDHHFVQWRTGTPSEPGEPFDFSTPITDDIMVFAEYEIIDNSLNNTNTETAPVP